MQAIASADQDTGPAADYYPRFHAAVALAQLNDWLPPTSQLLIDMSGPGSCAAEIAAYAGHHVLRVIDISPGGTLLAPGGRPPGDPPIRGARPPYPPGAHSQKPRADPRCLA